MKFIPKNLYEDIDNKYAYAVNQLDFLNNELDQMLRMDLSSYNRNTPNVKGFCASLSSEIDDLLLVHNNSIKEFKAYLLEMDNAFTPADDENLTNRIALHIKQVFYKEILCGFEHRLGLCRKIIKYLSE